MGIKSVVYVVKMFPRISETFIINEILALEALGLKIRIISLYSPDLKVAHQQLKSIRAPVHYLPESFWRDLPHMLRAQAHFMLNYPSRWIRAFSIMFWRHSFKSTRLWLQSGRVAKDLEGTDVGHVHAHFSHSPTTLAMMASTFLDLRFSFTCHAKDVYADGRISSPGFFRNLNRACFVVCASARTKKDIVDAWPNSQPGKIHVVYNGLDLERFQRRTTEPKAGLILSVGRFVEKKGFPHLIEACGLLRNHSVPFSCEIAGYGPMRKNLVDLISSLGLEGQVRLVGAVPQQDLIAYYQRANVFCLATTIASNEDRDILPNVVKEAMAVGVPVTTTSIPGMDELVENGRTGLLVPEKNYQALADALELLLDDPELGKRLALAGGQLIEERFDRRKNVKALLRLFEPYLVS